MYKTVAMAGKNKSTASDVRRQLLELMDIAVAVLKRARGMDRLDRDHSIAANLILAGALRGETDTRGWRKLVREQAKRQVALAKRARTAYRDAYGELPEGSGRELTAKDHEQLLQGLASLGRVTRLAAEQQLVADFLVAWNEGSGAHVERFWAEVARRKLPFKRKDPVAEALARGRIRGRSEYEAAVDGIVVRQQEGALSETDARRLSKMIGAYEAAQAKRAASAMRRVARRAHHGNDSIE